MDFGELMQFSLKNGQVNIVIVCEKKNLFFLHTLNFLCTFATEYIYFLLNFKNY